MKIIRLTPGLGNQMFQYAFILNYKLRGERIAFDLIDCVKNKRHNGFELERVFNIKEYKISKFGKLKIIGPYLFILNNEINFFKLYRKIIKIISIKNIIPIFNNYIQEDEVISEFNFNKKYLEIKNKINSYFCGYFSSFKYFEDIKEEVKKVFTFSEVVLEEDKNNFEVLEEIKRSESVSIHIRRGDYLTIDFFNICNKKYFEDAFNFLENKLLVERKIKKENIKIFIFSDDMNWCKNNLDFLKDYDNTFVDWNRKGNSYKDMQLMSECKHNIIPNSTFSWWAAYLNKNSNKIVLAPKYWLYGVKTSYDRCEEKWILM